MSIDHLSFTHFRNLAQKKVVFHPEMNFIFGSNGSGKTSLLEAIYFLSTGRSFRTRSIETILNRNLDAKEFILFGQLADSLSSHKVGMSKSIIQASQIKVDKELVRSASQLAKLSPTILIDPHSFELLNGAPGQRRQFIDWGVFHVEHSFVHSWSNYINCLKQRNSLLRNAKIDRILLDVWDSRLAEFGELVNQGRKAYFEKLQRPLHDYLNYFALDENIKITFSMGWDKTKSLLDSLRDFREKDIERKFTQVGPHRADIRLTLNGQAVKDTLSRGQQKLLIIAMYLSQMQTLQDIHQRQTVVLVDDISAELDENNLRQVFSKLMTLEAQVIATILNDSVVNQLQLNSGKYKMFHVEHGDIKELE